MERGKCQPTKGRHTNLYFLSPRERNLSGQYWHTVFLLPDGRSPARGPRARRQVQLGSHRFFKMFAKLLSCYHANMRDFTWKSGFLSENGRSSSTRFSASASSSLLEQHGAVQTWLGLSGSSQPYNVHFSPSRHQCVSGKAAAYVATEGGKGQSNPVGLEITMLQETELSHLVGYELCISENMFKSGFSFLDHFPKENNSAGLLTHFLLKKNRI